jgi:hypothetical protein
MNKEKGSQVKEEEKWWGVRVNNNGGKTRQCHYSTVFLN